jgi:hypothetical protein
MNYEEANQVLNNTKFGIFEPSYKVTQALIVTGDIDGAIDYEPEDRSNINPPFIVGPKFD